VGTVLSDIDSVTVATVQQCQQFRPTHQYSNEAGLGLGACQGQSPNALAQAHLVGHARGRSWSGDVEGGLGAAEKGRVRGAVRGSVKGRCEGCEVHMWGV